MKFLLAGCVLFVSHAVFGQESKKAKIEEFFSVESAWVQEKNEMQVTVKPGILAKSLFFSLQLEYGITKKLQIQSEFFSNGQKELGLLYRLTNEQSPVFMSAGLNMETFLFSSRKINAGERMEWQLSLHLAKTLGVLEMHGNLFGETGNNEFNSGYQFATAAALKVWRVTFEIKEAFNVVRNLTYTSGILWKGLEDFELGAAIVSSNNKEKGIILMATREFSLKHKRR